MNQPTKFQRDRALSAGHGFSGRHDSVECWLCGKPRIHALHVTDFLDYKAVLEGIQRHLRNQAEAAHFRESLASVAFTWSRIVDGEPTHVEPEEGHRLREPTGLFLDLANPGDYNKEGPLTRYDIRFVADSDVETSGGKKLPRFGLYRAAPTKSSTSMPEQLICTYVGSVDLVEAHRDAVRAHCGEFAHVAAIRGDAGGDE